MYVQYCENNVTVQIQLEIKNHCHEIRSPDVSNAIVKIKSDKIRDNGFVYSNNLFLVLAYYTRF